MPAVAADESPQIRTIVCERTIRAYAQASVLSGCVKLRERLSIGAESGDSSACSPDQLIQARHRALPSCLDNEPQAR